MLGQMQSCPPLALSRCSLRHSRTKQLLQQIVRMIEGMSM